MRRVAVRCESPEATRDAGRALGEAVERVPPGGLTIALLGELGAGKTVFAGGLLAGLGVSDRAAVVSPTFTIARGYRGRMPIVHVDAYHLQRMSDLEAAGFEDMRGEGRVTVVEWGDRIAAALPMDRLEVTLTPISTPIGDATTTRDDPLVAARAAQCLPRSVEIVALGPTSARVIDRLGDAVPVASRSPVA